MTGLRPSSLSTPRTYAGTDQYPKWEDIHSIRDPDKARGLFFKLVVQCVKARRDKHAEKNQTSHAPVYLLRPCRKTYNLVADLTWLLPMLALERGRFGTRTLQEIETDLKIEVQQDPLVSKQLVCVAFHNRKMCLLPMNERISVRAEQLNRPL